ARLLGHAPHHRGVPATHGGAFCPLSQVTRQGLRPHASGASARRRTQTVAARRKYRYEHCPPLWPPTDARRMREPSALLLDWSARDGATRTRLPHYTRPALL